MVEKFVFWLVFEDVVADFDGFDHQTQPFVEMANVEELVGRFRQAEQSRGKMSFGRE